MKLPRILLSLAMVVITLGGCTMKTVNLETEKSNKGESTMILTERQKAILDAQGLPTDYDELYPAQKSAITAIEIMLNYLDQRYGDGFAYEGYISAGGTQKETLLAVRDELHVKVFRDYNDGQYMYSDTYAEQLASPVYTEVLDAYVSSVLGKNVAKVYSEVTAAEDEFQKENIISQASAVSYVFVPESTGQGAFQALIEQYCTWIPNNADGRKTHAIFLLVKDEDFHTIFASNYAQRFVQVKPVEKVNCLLYEDGRINRY